MADGIDLDAVAQVVAHLIGTTENGAEVVEALVAERDAALARMRAVEALCFAGDDGSEWQHRGDCRGEPECPACWAADIRSALADPDDAELIRTAEQRIANDDGRRYTLDEVTAALAAPTEDSDR